MSDANFTKLARNKDLIDAIKHSRCVIRIWQEVCDILQRDDIDVSGRLTLTQSVGQRVVEWKGVERIKKQFQVPTLMLDATLPALPVLQVYHPEVEIVADIKVALPPCARIRQALGAPTSASKLIRSSDRLKHLQAVRRYIIKRHIETGQQATLIICQEKVEQWLLQSELPANIVVKHFNDISGIDDHRHDRLLVLVGRVAPGPYTVEALSGALTGRQPQLVPLEAG
ncbi:MAG: hypothetical protein ACXU9A_02460 [Xanthobacteraceae bacterium]